METDPVSITLCSSEYYAMDRLCNPECYTPSSKPPGIDSQHGSLGKVFFGVQFDRIE
jgi:hypothetical protein